MPRNQGARPAEATEPRSGQPEHSLGVLISMKWQFHSGTESPVQLADGTGRAPDLVIGQGIERADLDHVAQILDIYSQGAFRIKLEGTLQSTLEILSFFVCSWKNFSWQCRINKTSSIPLPI